MYTVEQIKHYADGCWIFDVQSGERARGFSLLAGTHTSIMCMPDTNGDYRWTLNRCPSSESTIRIVLAAMAGG